MVNPSDFLATVLIRRVASAESIQNLEIIPRRKIGMDERSKGGSFSEILLAISAVVEVDLLDATLVVEDHKGDGECEHEE